MAEISKTQELFTKFNFKVKPVYLYENINKETGEIKTNLVWPKGRIKDYNSSDILQYQNSPSWKHFAFFKIGNLAELNLIVLDCEAEKEKTTKGDGVGFISGLIAVNSCGAFKATLQQTSKSGGKHYFFKIPNGKKITDYKGFILNDKSKILIEVRQGAGISYYEAEDHNAEIQELPAWFETFILKSETEKYNEENWISENEGPEQKDAILDFPILHQMCSELDGKLDNRMEWVDCGMALHHHYRAGRLGFQLWELTAKSYDNWSRDKDVEQLTIWFSFNTKMKNRPKTIGTLLGLAKSKGITSSFLPSERKKHKDAFSIVKKEEDTIDTAYCWEKDPYGYPIFNQMAYPRFNGILGDIFGELYQNTYKQRTRAVIPTVLHIASEIFKNYYIEDIGLAFYTFLIMAPGEGKSVTDILNHLPDCAPVVPKTDVVFVKEIHKATNNGLIIFNIDEIGGLLTAISTSKNSFETYISDILNVAYNKAGKPLKMPISDSARKELKSLNLDTEIKQAPAIGLHGNLQIRKFNGLNLEGFHSGLSRRALLFFDNSEKEGNDMATGKPNLNKFLPIQETFQYEAKKQILIPQNFKKLILEKQNKYYKFATGVELFDIARKNFTIDCCRMILVNCLSRNFQTLESQLPTVELQDFEFGIQFMETYYFELKQIYLFKEKMNYFASDGNTKNKTVYSWIVSNFEKLFREDNLNIGRLGVNLTCLETLLYQDFPKSNFIRQQRVEAMNILLERKLVACDQIIRSTHPENFYFVK